ncbi:protein-disulfide reductase DsbD [Thalassotalea aquiviva]|uniref:protein-disulfide reductase DsbD n=1 Tax=Thalassotalea aquiviva TaxID=3242415 RepID=UPI003529FDF5
MRSIFSIFLLVLSTFSYSAHAQDSIFDTSLNSLFSNQQEFLHVDQAFQLDFYQQGEELELFFNIADGYYLYQNKLKFSIKNGDISDTILPPAVDHEDEYFGIQPVYYEQAKIGVIISQAVDNAELTVTYQGCASKGLCYPPTKKTLPINKLILPASDASAASPLNVLSAISSTANPLENVSNNAPEAISLADNSVSQQHELASMLAGNSLLLTLLSFFGLGVLLSFTPCVFPMYPILTGIIVGQGNQLTTKKAIALSFSYVQGMAITYTLLGVVVALAGAQFQAAFQHPAVLIILSILFVFLALSMFGVFNLSLPASWQNKLTHLSNKQKGGSSLSVFVMGAISGLVASPCTTAPLTGALIYIAQTGDVVIGGSALYALSLGMGLPLLVLGSSGGKLLPKAGQWMNVIKNIFGLLLLAVPIFLLERFIDESVANLLWALLGLSAATYFYVVNSKTNTGSFWFGLRSLIIFMMLFFSANFGYQTLFPSTSHINAPAHKEFVKVSSLDELYQQVANANANGQSVMLDLYADWCAACKEFEKYTFPKPEVQKALENTLLVQIDLTDTGTDANVEIMSHFNVFGLPSILFFDQQGNELDSQRITGFMSAPEFAAHIEKLFS